MNVPATIAMRPASGKDAEIKQQELHLLAQGFARRRQYHSRRSGVAVAIIKGAEERSDDGLRRTENAVGNLLDPSREAGLQSERNEEVLDGARREENSPLRLIPFLANGDAEEIASNFGEVIGLRF